MTSPAITNVYYSWLQLTTEEQREILRQYPYLAPFLEEDRPLRGPSAYFFYKLESIGYWFITSGYYPKDFTNGMRMSDRPVRNTT